MLYGRETRNPSDIKLDPSNIECSCLEYHVARTIHGLSVANEVACENQMKRYQDCSQNGVHFKVGDQAYRYASVVKLYCSKKLSNVWNDLFVIVRKTAPVNYSHRFLYTNRSAKVPFHAYSLKHALSRNTFPSDDDIALDGDTLPSCRDNRRGTSSGSG